MLSYRDTLLMIKDELSKLDFVSAISVYGSITEGDFLESSKIELFILLNEIKYVDNVKKTMLSIEKETNHSINCEIYSIEDMDKDDNEIIKFILKEGKLIYWNSLHDFSAIHIFRIRPCTIFTFDMSKLEQKTKAKLNYQLYGKKQSKGMLAELEGKRLSKSCFYVAFNKKYRIIRFFDKWDIKYEAMECWV